MYKRYIVQIILALSVLVSLPTFAEEEKAGPKLAYFTLEPDLTTNFYTKGKKLGYVQVRIDVMVMSSEDLALVERHQPLIRNAVVEMLGQQTEETVKSLAGREDLRKNLVAHLNEILLPETGKTVIADLLFTKYLYQ
ncbi:flagellar basal body-associated protein FliL [Vibrio navarrensis]|uniref:flagellar basal body-associated protein FliL n=1 Tax=Vibrio navarrensis TaxID=29495 RepID=UPI001868AF0B|nr:flagellar basal body-associated protein FliL [Vibrio navarrensis]EJK2116252.1 flagellar basal body-associated protein FliL [Vibrio navarrensis]MBE3666665.1 flagellar basal body-associated protein FliL [Vibrio navarrensis]MBE4575181.1 flagellar basal body-associated protein FliL [Vibrio navarrensis]MBE4578716.1 flagellar basal body-associated protein FliL [Vibrio navarrensis]MBE4597443.1 flagellar basal body-associated protein FliL [Vibrio navarrensis]